MGHKELDMTERLIHTHTYIWVKNPEKKKGYMYN